MQLRLTLDVPPSVNHLYKIGNVTRNKKRVLGQFMTDEGTTYKHAVGWTVRKVVVEQGIDVDPKGYYGYIASVRFASAGRDLDNGLKVMQDAIFEALHINDDRVVEFCVGKLVDPKHPRVDILIYSIDLATIQRRYGDIDQYLKRKEPRRVLQAVQ
jgi:crossover junction endodeoxyribonuclease RusA